MHNLLKLVGKSQHLAVGLMSGTSMDGVDAALVKIENVEDLPKIELKSFQTVPYPEELREALADLAVGHEVTAENIATIDTGVAVAFASAFFNVCREGGASPDSIDFIGSHGQTVAHVPPGGGDETETIAGTLQLGAPSMIAALCAVTTVGDFRVGDIALGGQGAPLAPFADFLIRRSRELSRVILNIGGIANLTYLPRGCSASEVIAFDTGPGNMVIDELYRVLYPGRGPFDESGAVAATGTINDELLAEFCDNEYFRKPPPKSAGHREFGPRYAWQLQASAQARGLTRKDTLATAADLTAVTIVDAIERFVMAQGELDEILVTGGGAHNQAIIGGLRRGLNTVELKPIDELGVSGDAKEAVDFAVLARETLFGRPNVLTNVTGSSRALPLGSISWGS